MPLAAHPTLPLLLPALLLAACASAPAPAPAPPVPTAAASTAAPAPSPRPGKSLDWPGQYSGQLPCADCEGITTTLELQADLSYTLQTRYLGKGEGQVFKQRGRFEWLADGSTIRLLNPQGGPDRYRVAEGRVTQLDLSGQPITGALAERYVLSKQASPAPDPQLIAGGREWRLVELMGQPVAAGAGGRRPSLVVSAEGRSVSGFAGCNSYGGALTLGEPQRLRFGPLAATLRACAEGMALEQQFLQVLSQADGYHAEAGRLQLLRARMAPLARFELAQP
jgi:heat shock protein HslJ